MEASNTLYGKTKMFISKKNPMANTYTYNGNTIDLYSNSEIASLIGDKKFANADFQFSGPNTIRMVMKIQDERPNSRPLAWSNVKSDHAVYNHPYIKISTTGNLFFSGKETKLDNGTYHTQVETLDDYFRQIKTRKITLEQHAALMHELFKLFGNNPFVNHNYDINMLHFKKRKSETK